MSVRVLIVDARSERSHTLERALVEAGFEVLMITDEYCDLHGLVERLEPDAVLIDTRLPSRDVLEHLGHINRRYPRPMIVFSREADSALTRQAARAGVSAYVVEGLVPSLVRSLIDVAIESFETHRQLKHELNRARETLNQRRTIDRAKTALMERYGVSEAIAYGQLRKLAMDRRTTVFELAGELLEQLVDTRPRKPGAKSPSGDEGDDR